MGGGEVLAQSDARSSDDNADEEGSKSGRSESASGSAEGAGPEHQMEGDGRAIEVDYGHRLEERK